MEDNVQIYEHAVASELIQLQLEKLETDWVTEVIENDFLHCQDLPLFYDEILGECHVSARFTNLQRAFSCWLNSTSGISENNGAMTSARQSIGNSEMPENSSSTFNTSLLDKGAKFWGFLFQEKKVNIQNLLALTGFFIDRGSTLASSFDERELCFEAAKMYLTMICIPGSMAFRVFHQMLYMKSLQLILLYVQIRKYQQKNATQSQQAKKSQRQPAIEVEDNEEDTPLGVEEIASVEKAISSYLDALLLVPQHLSLKRYPNILKETVECILPVISLDRGTVSLKALEIVQNFCTPLHGDAVQTVHHVFVHILPHLTLDPGDKDLNNKNLIALKEISFKLVRTFVAKFGAVIYPLLQGVIKHICTEVVDKSEYRQKTAQTALDLLQLIPAEHQQGIIRWFLLLAYAEPAYLRLLSTEILSILLQNGRVDMPIFAVIFAVIFALCSDPSATVRAKALSILGECIESNHPSMVEMLDIMFAEDIDRQTVNNEESKEIDIVELLQAEGPIEINSKFLPKASEIVSLLQERSLDEKVHVRKNALQLLLLVARRHGRYLTLDLLKLLGNACRDIAMLIRRNVAQMLTELLSEHPENEATQKIWAQSVLPLVLDGETRVQEKALECADQMVLRPLLGHDSRQGWTLLEVIIEEGLDIYLSKAVEVWSRQQQIPAQLPRALLANSQERPRAALTFVAILARHAIIDANVKKFTLDYLHENISSQNPVIVCCLQQVYKTIGACLPSMNKENIETVRTISSRSVAHCHLPTNLISTVCDMVVYCIQQQVKDESEAQKEAALWAGEIISDCGEFLSSHLRKQDAVLPEEEEQLARRILILGSVGLHCPRQVNKRHFLVLQHAAFQPESGVDAPIPFSQPQSQPKRKLPPRLQAAAIISLGKLSVQHEEMAKQLIPGLGRLLETTPHETVRNNIVCCLCDWVIRYATAIDPVMPQVTACLRDPIPAVRKQTLVLLIHLLQEDYLKIRGTFFFRILQLACDDDEGLRVLAHFYVTQRLLHRQPTIIQQHFIESVFHFNDYKGHPTYNKFALTERERKLFSIAGQQNAERRFQIYQFMLQNIDDEARFQLTFRLTRDVLHGVVEDVMSLKKASTEAVLKDALAVLSSEDIKLASLAASTEDDPVEKEDIAQAIVQSTKKAIIAQVVKRNVIENIVPIVVALKRKLAANKSSLMGNLMQFLRELMKDYKDEIQEILAEDRQLMAEIDFDLKRFEQQERLDAELRTSRVERTVPPAELINPHEGEQARTQQGDDRRSRINHPTTESTETSTNNAELSKGESETPVGAVESNPSESIPPTTVEGQEPVAESNERNGKQFTTERPNASSSPNGESEAPVEKDAPMTDTSRAFLQPEIPKVPLVRNVATKRILRSRVMSTPIRNVPHDDVSFQIRDVDISDIHLHDPNQTDSLPELEASAVRPKRRRR
ncbi:condensin-2 complex subunit D3-L-like [Daphnia carinata]|uniref:condensin-2 complex subunit D3-L-like n=1 Tax=Daphnia carinata TaxID=120202 RepID=UPI00257E6238|nr:condensin-2 complex subunit D3-L-like [Daphnia carinata]